MLWAVMVEGHDGKGALGTGEGPRAHMNSSSSFEIAVGIENVHHIHFVHQLSQLNPLVTDPKLVIFP